MKNQIIKQKSRLLIVDDDKLSRSTVEGMLCQDFDCASVDSGLRAISYIKKFSPPDAVVMDYHMPGCNGIETMQMLKKYADFRHVPVVFLTGIENEEIQRQCWKVGAADFISKPVRAQDIRMRLEHQIQVKRRECHLEELACKDALTSLYNRQFFVQSVPRLIRQMNRERAALSVLMIDIDDFKKYNDTYGHLKGDEVIKRVAGAIAKGAQRPLDLLFRFGGEEFVVILPKVSLPNAKVVANRISSTVRGLFIKNAKSSYGRVTVSIGAAASYQGEKINFIDLLKKADKAMYKAKCAGKNMLVASIPKSIASS
ncbi:diguanylate cyclase [Alteromonas gracilis]|uniref:GGDEF domain-containing response regulator n=1 Tax=Alteromonas gracilis TaxID=1479524 RepID=UPI003735EDDE